MQKAYKYIINNPGIACAVMLLGLILWLPYMYLWDEDWYMQSIQFIQKYGLSVNFIANNSAAPMHAVIYYLLLPITHGNPLIARFINYAMCFGICSFSYKTLKLYKENSLVSYTYSLGVFAVPSFLVIGFFAITEAPCLLFYGLSTYLLLLSFKKKNNIGIAFISGLALGCAILTRQMFVLCIGVPFVLIFYPCFLYNLKVLIPFAIGALLVCLPVFYIWKGIVPPTSIFRHQVTQLFRLKYGFLSLGYTFFYLACLIPVYLFNFYKKHVRWVLPLIVIGIGSSFLVQNASFLPMSGFLPRFLSVNGIDMVARIYYVTTCVLAFLLVFFFIHEIIQYRQDFVQIFLILSIFTIICTPFFISSQFSSRYPLQAAPLMLVYCYTRLKPVNTLLQSFIFIACVFINFISVVTFLY